MTCETVREACDVRREQCRVRLALPIGTVQIKPKLNVSDALRVGHAARNISRVWFLSGLFQLAI